MSNTFNETFVNFDESIEDLEEQIEELEAKASDLEDDNPRRAQLLSQRSRIDSQRKGAVWARDRAYESDDFPQWDEDVDGITLAALRAGAYGGLQDDVESDPNAGSGTSTNLLVAEGTVEAPYIDEGMSDADKAQAVSQLHPFFRNFAEGRINELMDPEAGNGSSSGKSQRETQRSETSTTERPSDMPKQ